MQTQSTTAEKSLSISGSSCLTLHCGNFVHISLLSIIYWWYSVFSSLFPSHGTPKGGGLAYQSSKALIINSYHHKVFWGPFWPIQYKCRDLGCCFVLSFCTVNGFCTWRPDILIRIHKALKGRTTQDDPESAWVSSLLLIPIIWL